MKICLNELKNGDFFEYRREEDAVPLLYQKIIPTKDYNAVLLNKGELYNISPSSKQFEQVSISIIIERDPLPPLS